MPTNPYEPPKERGIDRPKLSQGVLAPLNLRDLIWLVALAACLFYWWVDRAIYVSYYRMLQDYVDSQR